MYLSEWFTQWSSGMHLYNSQSLCRRCVNWTSYSILRRPTSCWTSYYSAGRSKKRRRRTYLKPSRPRTFCRRWVNSRISIRNQSDKALKRSYRKSMPAYFTLHWNPYSMSNRSRVNSETFSQLLMHFECFTKIGTFSGRDASGILWGCRTRIITSGSKRPSLPKISLQVSRVVCCWRRWWKRVSCFINVHDSRWAI